MKPRSNSFVPFISIVASVIAMAQSASAATGTWSGLATDTWDTTDVNWSGVSGTPWDNTNGPSNTAVFNTASLAAVVGGPVDTNGITFTLTGALSGSTINLAGTTPGIAVATGETGNISSTVAGSAGLIKSDAGLLTLSDATYTGGTTVTGGRLVLENNKTGGSTFTTNAELEFNHSSGTQQLDGGTISGTGKLIKTGGSTLMLGGNGSAQNISLASGALIDVQGGTLRNEYGQGVWTGNLADLNVETGATFDIWDCNTIVDAITGTGTINDGWWGTNSLTIGDDNGGGTFSGTISNSAGPLTLIKNGSGTQTLTGSISYNGGTTVNGGRLVLQDTTTGSANLTTNAELEFQVTTGTQILSNGGTINGTGNLIKTGSGNLQLGWWNGPQTIALTGASSIIDIQAGNVAQSDGNSAWGSNLAGMNIASLANFTIGNGSASVDELTGSGRIGCDQGGLGTLTVGVNSGSGTFSGSAPEWGWGQVALVKQGTGTQTLNGSGLYLKGGVTVNGGRLVMENITAGIASFTTNAELEFNFTSGTGQINGGTISGSGKLIKSGTSTLMLGANGSAQTVALTAGSLIDVQGGVLRNEYGNSAWGGNKADLNVESGTFFDIWDGDTVVDALTGSGTINKGWANNNSLTFGADNGSGTFSGTISQGAQSYGGSNGGNFSLIKDGTGTQTLSGANTYIGTTTVTEGTLALVGGSHASAIAVSTGASLGFTLGSPTTSSSSFDLTDGTIKITGTPDGTSTYTLITSSTGITGTPALHTPVPGYDLDVDGGTSLKLVPASGSGYAAWAATNAPSGTSADDFDGDGVTNGVEYVLGGDKDTNDLGKLPQVSSSGANMVVTFDRKQTSIDGTTTLTIKVGTDLVTWPLSYNVPGTALTNNPGVTVAKDTSTGFDTVTLTIPRAPDAKKFACLEVVTE